MTDLAQYKDILEARKRELYSRLHKIEKDLDTLKSGDSGERAVERENDEVLEEFGVTGLKELEAIDAALEHGLSQALIESTNTKIRVLTRIAFGFHNPAALIALAMLALGGHRPALPDRS